MTDTGPPTQVDDVIVTGQRARGPSPFSNLQWPSRASGEQVAEVTPADGTDAGGGPLLTDEDVQCATPEGRRQWDSDAKAREAISAFRRAAETRYDEDLQNREFGALLCEFSDGRIELSPVSDGPPVLDPEGNAIVYEGGRPYVGIPPSACVSGTPVGFVHSHPGSNAGLPSLGDFAFAQYLVDYYGADPSVVGIYTVASYKSPQGVNQDKVSRALLADRDRSQQQGYEPEWVDPDATPCPGSSS